MCLAMKGRTYTIPFFLQQPLMRSVEIKLSPSFKVERCRWGNAVVCCSRKVWSLSLRPAPAWMVCSHSWCESSAGCRTRRNTTFPFYYQQALSLSGLYHEMSDILLLTLHVPLYPKSKSKEGVREDKTLINLTLLWTKPFQRDCIFVTSWTSLWCVCTVCVCVFPVITWYQHEFDMHLIFLLESPRAGGCDTWGKKQEYWVPTTAGKESKSVGKAIDCGGTGIVTIVSIHIISSQLLYLAFRRKRRTACSGSPASPYS